jgi:hypothetical protein
MYTISQATYYNLKKYENSDVISNNADRYELHCATVKTLQQNTAYLEYDM